MNKNLLSGIAAATFAASLALAAPASAAVTFDSATGTGFVGKGDVQLALNWNNKDLQSLAEGVDFTAEVTEVEEWSWECTNLQSGNTVERARSTTTTTQGVIDAETRDSKKQVTGFNIIGYVGTSTSTTTSEGQPLNHCPGQNSRNLTFADADNPVVSSSGILRVTHASTGVSGTVSF